jgi:hypothetical protein
VLVDDDGSETLYLVLGGLTSGAKLNGVDEAAMLYLGNGEWAVEASAVNALTISPVENYSGEKPFPSLTLRAISQEVDSDESSSDLWTITFDVLPVADGFKNWSPSFTITEGENEVNNTGISLASAGNFTLEDDDGSEVVIEFKFDLSNLIARAGIEEQLKIVAGDNQASLDKLVSDYIAGDFSFDGTILTVLADKIGGVKIDAQLFKDSNQGFAIPVEARVEDSATIDNTLNVVSKIEKSTFNVNLIGTADIPTVYANDISGCRKIEIDLGGETTDTDVELGRVQSESIYYIVAATNLAALPGYRFIDNNYNTVGFDGGGQTWILPFDKVKNAKEAGGLFFYTRDRVAGDAATFQPAEFKLWSVSKENDETGDEATNIAEFSVTYWAGNCSVGGVDPIAPLPPILTIGPNVGLEDTDLPLDVSASADPADSTNPTISIVVSNIPAGFEVSGKAQPGFYFNYETGTYSALAAYFAAGNVLLTPPKDFAGTVSLTVEAIAVNSWFLSTSSGEETVSVYFDPVADGVAISIPGIETGGLENEEIPLPITLSTLDIDGSERLGDSVYVKSCVKSTLKPSYTLVKSTDNDASVDGVNVVGYRRVPSSEVNSLSMQPSDYWHGQCPVSVVAFSIETSDDEDEDYMKATKATFNVNIVSVATTPRSTAPKNVSGTEDSVIVIPGLSASLVDTVDDNGYERLSTVITNVPEGSIFNYGSNSGEGRWAIPTDKLSSLSVTPPLHYAGSFNMTFTAISFDVATSTEANTSSDILVQVAPVADFFYILAKNVDVVQGRSNVLNLTIRMEDTRGNEKGEVAPEKIHLTFDAVPLGVSFTSPAGGALTKQGGIWTFLGSEAAANGIVAVTTSQTPVDSFNITILAKSIDGPSILSPPIRDTFLLKVLNSNTQQSRALRVGEEGKARELSGCGEETSIVGETRPGLFSLDQYPVTVKKQGNNSVAYTLSSAILSPSVSNWAAIMYPSAPLGETVCEAVNPDTAMTYVGNCYDSESRAYLFLNIPNAPSGTENAYVPTSCVGMYPKPDARTIMVELSIPCSSCDGGDSSGGNDFLFADDDSPANDDAYDDDTISFDDDAYARDDGTVVQSSPGNRQLQDAEIQPVGTSWYWGNDILMSPPTSLDSATRRLLLASKHPKYRTLQEQEANGEIMAASDVSLNVEVVGGDGELEVSSGPSTSMRSFWMITIVTLAGTCLLTSILLF